MFLRERRIARHERHGRCDLSLHLAVVQSRVTAFSTHDTRVDETRRRKVMNLSTRLRALVRDDSGQDLLEYALLVALIALVAVAAVTTAGVNVNTIFSNIATALATAA